MPLSRPPGFVLPILFLGLVIAPTIRVSADEARPDTTVTAAPEEPRFIAATFNFGPLPENPEVPKGAYTMAGTFDSASRHMTLKGVEWIDAPFLYVMVDLDGRINAAGNVITGDVPGPGCTVFELRRDAQLIG